jgi:hypothetical protein
MRSRLVSERTTRSVPSLLDCGIAVAKGPDRLRAALPGILGTRRLQCVLWTSDS